MDNEEERSQQAALDRATRDAVQRKIYPILKVYRLKVEAIFPSPSPILETLPALTENAGATPQPGSLTGNYNAGTNSAVLTGQPSPSGSVVRHQIRASVGTEPSLEDEALSAEFEVGDPIELTTNYGFGAPGAIVHFRLVAITADGHEKGTPWLMLQRPL